MFSAFDFENAPKFELGVSIEDNIKTLRDLPLFGATYFSINFRFRYPFAAHLRAMPKDKPIEAIKLAWKPSATKGNYIGAIQVIYSNGAASPVFFAKD